MAFTSDHDPRINGRAALLLAMVALMVGCRSPGLPPEPPGHDASDAQAEIAAYAPGPNPLSTSAFAGQKLRKRGHHHHHGGHAEPAPADRTPPADADQPRTDQPRSEARP